MSDTQKIILFDCDGTLVDTETLSSAACVAALADFGVVYEQNPFQDEFIGMHLSVIVRELGARHAKPDMSYEAFVAAYKQRMLEQVALNMQPDVVTAAYLQSLKERGYKMAVCSNGVREVVLAELEAVGILPFFDAVITGDEVKNPKPAPDMFLKGMQMLGGQNAESVYVLEDSLTGLRAALAAKMKAIGFVGFSHAPKEMAETLEKAGAKSILTDLSQLDLLLN